MQALLKKIGLTEGEIKVYQALIHLRQSSVGLIIKESKISASKVYVILDKLIDKGLVSYIVENNIKQFSPTNPENILELIAQQEKELEETKQESKQIIKQLAKDLGKYQTESAQIYKGYPGIKTAIFNIISELDSKNDYLFFSVSKNEFSQATEILFNQVALKRKEKEINSRGICDTNIKTEMNKLKHQKDLKFKFYDLTLPISISIGTTKIIMVLYGPTPIGFEITSKQITQNFRTYFEKLWKNITEN